ncbi:MAG: hypothetical protein HYZ42_11305 [Bacteroidetes bacterium]|nr:hypothetical protein [Bacteroidota bacterium]
MEKSRIGNLKIILSGILIVNIPVMIIILLSLFLLMTFAGTSFNISLLIGAAIAWSYWSYASLYWIKWCLIRGVEKERLHRQGMRSLVLWPSDLKRIESEESKLNI